MSTTSLPRTLLVSTVPRRSQADQLHAGMNIVSLKNSTLRDLKTMFVTVTIVQTSLLYLYLTAGPPRVELDSKLVGETVVVNAGSDLVMDGAVGGKPEPTVYWAKGDKILEPGEKYSLTYTATRAMAVVKNCDRFDSGRYILTVKNASGIKTATVNVKVLGKNSQDHKYVL